MVYLGIDLRDASLYMFLLEEYSRGLGSDFVISACLWCDISRVVEILDRVDVECLCLLKVLPIS